MPIDMQANNCTTPVGKSFKVITSEKIINITMLKINALSTPVSKGIAAFLILPEL